MGVSIVSKNKAIDLGYGGFNRLRTKVSELINSEIAKHYKELEQSSFLFGEKREEYIKKYDAETERLDKKYDYKYNSVLHFLYACDWGATMKVDVCKELYEVIKDYDDDDTLYGYSGREDCTRFKDFKELVKDCIDNNEPMEWC
ncbi:hypothetical protein FDC57_18555 [Clostridium botulinum]|nr:hypothetical protein [Clostridium botulinum]NFS02399.1 hypothetical protein [Clostridium botulinum]NFT97443.1 hypothetical protein [Clostridium botulinum]